MNAYRSKEYVEAVLWNQMGDSDLVVEGYKGDPDSFSVWPIKEAPYLSRPIPCYVYQRVTGVWCEIKPGEYLVREEYGLINLTKERFESKYEPVISYQI
jgi:hypothetical protein